ncbi:2-hydroxychromene-2-carboxylate isomerase [Sorangium sp. So ce388]|uniref:2-hydroxychromene-2-carboxylate isomerase n=1 Tax=Sorangium sp. So ce388 TaxID=3133309 RepID=UPI003F5BD2BF
MTRQVECWFDFGSNYSYIAVSRITPLARDARVDIVWRPFLLGPVFKRLGWDTSPFVLQKEKGEYAFMDTARQCARYGVPWRRPTTFPRAAVHTMRVAAAFAEQPWVGDYCRRVMQMNFAEDRDINTDEVAVQVLDELGLDGRKHVQEAHAEPRRARLRAFSEEAIRRKIFGAPTFFVGDEMFWGNDRLEDALARASAG